MSRAPVLSERPRGSRIDDLGPTHIWASPKTGHSSRSLTPERAPAGLASAMSAATRLRTVAPMR
jgi:hypothetical protein